MGKLLCDLFTEMKSVLDALDLQLQARACLKLHLERLLEAQTESEVLPSFSQVARGFVTSSARYAAGMEDVSDTYIPAGSIEISLFLTAQRPLDSFCIHTFYTSVIEPS